MRLLLCILSVLLVPSLVRADASTLVTYVRESDEFFSAHVIDTRSQTVWYSYQADLPHPAASLTKLVMALTFLQKHIDWTRTITLMAKDEVGGGRLRLVTGAKMSVRDAWISSLAGSANNATMMLARITGLNAKRFLSSMNYMAKKLGASQSHFFDPAGMDERNITTARDMTMIALKAFNQPDIRRASTVASYSFPAQQGRQRLTKTIKNTNHLLLTDDEVWVTGGKTGYLEEAQYNFVVRLRPIEDGVPVANKELLVVVLGAPTKEGSFASAKRLAQTVWISDEFSSH